LLSIEGDTFSLVDDFSSSVLLFSKKTVVVFGGGFFFFGLLGFFWGFEVWAPTTGR